MGTRKRKGCTKYRKTKNPKCNNQNDCNWEVGKGCKNKRSRNRRRKLPRDSIDELNQKFKNLMELRKKQDYSKTQYKDTLHIGDNANKLYQKAKEFAQEPNSLTRYVHNSVEKEVHEQINKEDTNLNMIHDNSPSFHDQMNFDWIKNIFDKQIHEGINRDYENMNEQSISPRVDYTPRASDYDVMSGEYYPSNISVDTSRVSPIDNYIPTPTPRVSDYEVMSGEYYPTNISVDTSRDSPRDTNLASAYMNTHNEEYPEYEEYNEYYTYNY